jgi:hypothetical protein
MLVGRSLSSSRNDGDGGAEQHGREEQCADERESKTLRGFETSEHDVTFLNLVIQTIW